MAFVTNTGTLAANPYPLTESYLQLAHPSVPNVLLLQQLDGSGKGYSPPSLSGTQKANGRANSGALIVSSARVNKLEWGDLAFVCSPQQAALLELLVLAQTGTTQCTVVDNMLKTAVTKVVAVDLPDRYKSIYSVLSVLLVQFSLSEV